MGLTYPSNKICPRCGTGGYVWYMDNSKYVAKCTNCGHYFRKEDFPMCVLYRTETSITNADRIRAMSDEELADKFEEVQLNAVKAYGNDDMLLAGELRKYWLDWLKQEVKG